MTTNRAAPEVMQQGKFTQAADCWSFGVTMWEVYARAVEPFIGHSNIDVIQIIVDNDITTELKKPRKCPDDVYEVMKSIWQLEPGKRPSFKDLLETLLALHDHPDNSFFVPAGGAGKMDDANSDGEPGYSFLEQAASLYGRTPAADDADPAEQYAHTPATHDYGPVDEVANRSSSD
jgi:Protein tyrosine and serine/threonine kinase